MEDEYGEAGGCDEVDDFGTELLTISEVLVVKTVTSPLAKFRQEIEGRQHKVSNEFHPHDHCLAYGFIKEQEAHWTASPVTIFEHVFFSEWHYRRQEL